MHKSVSLAMPVYWNAAHLFRKLIMVRTNEIAPEFKGQPIGIDAQTTLLLHIDLDGELFSESEANLGQNYVGFCV